MGHAKGVDDWKGEHLIRAKPSHEDRRVEASRVMAAAHKRKKDAKAKAAQAKKVKK
jgi:hypothetical protein